MSQTKIYQTTDELWSAVINSLPADVKEKVSAPAGRAYIHVRPKSKLLGVKDLKYTVEYSSRSAKATVNVETLNGGEEAKETIQNYIDSHKDDCFIKDIEAKQGAKNKNKWVWTVATETNELNEELVQWYVENLIAFYQFFEVEGELAVNNEGAEVSGNVELKDISKDATVWLSFTQNDDDEFYCYFHNIIKDGAMYFVGDNCGEIDDSDLDYYYDDLDDYDCWTESVEEEYADVESMAEQLVNDFVEARWEECECDKGAMPNADGCTITICVGGEKVFEWNSVGEKEAAKEKKTKQVRVAFFVRESPKFISLQTLCEDDMEVVDENGASEETYDYLLDNASGDWCNLAFVPSGCFAELYVTNPDAEDDDEYNLYTDEQFEICPRYGMMNMEEAEDNYSDDQESLDEYTAYLDVEMGEDHGRQTNMGIKSAWESLKSNEVNCENFVPAVMQYVVNEEGNDQAFLRGTQVEDITMAFYVDIPEDEDFDPAKLDFINMDASYDDNSEVLSDLLADDMVLLNAVIYDGKMYFADGYADVNEEYGGDCYYDIVDEDIASV